MHLPLPHPLPQGLLLHPCLSELLNCIHQLSSQSKKCTSHMGTLRGVRRWDESMHKNYTPNFDFLQIVGKYSGKQCSLFDFWKLKERHSDGQVMFVRSDHRDKCKKSTATSKLTVWDWGKHTFIMPGWITSSIWLEDLLPAASRIHHPQSSPHRWYVGESAESGNLTKTLTILSVTLSPKGYSLY